MSAPPSLEARRAALEAELGEPITVDGLTAAWSITSGIVKRMAAE